MRWVESGIKIVYDGEADVLYVTRGTPKYTEYIEHSEDVILRLDPDTKRLIGITIIGFSQHIRKSESAVLSDGNLVLQEGDMSENRRHILGLSGGKDSSALAIYMRSRVPEMEYAFCDTGKGTAGDV